MRLLLLLVSMLATSSAALGDTDENQFHAIGLSKPVVTGFPSASSTLPRSVRKVAVEVQFDLLPTMMRFSLPCYPCMVTENNIHYSNGWTETYDPKASNSCEVLWDRETRYARMWIESQNDARIVVRWRAALCDTDYYIAHSEIPSGSPYGNGDWTDEWYYIYPDGTHTRKVLIYTGLAPRSWPVTDQYRLERPPHVVYEFQECFIFGEKGHLPEDDIEVEALTLIKMTGESKAISFKPYPRHFGEFRDANIVVTNLKSRYRPFTIAIPHGVEMQSYPPEDDLPHVFQTWPKRPSNGYSSSLAHILNWWHYRRTDSTLEQIYLSGWTDSENPKDELLPLAWSWIQAPRLSMEGLEYRYDEITYDPSQKAYLLQCKGGKAKNLTFSLKAEESDPDHFIHIVNPVFIVKGWGDAGADLTINGQKHQLGKDFRIGHEMVGDTTNLIVWVNFKSSSPTEFSIRPQTVASPR